MFRFESGTGSYAYYDLCQRLKAVIEARPLPKQICAQDMPLPEGDADFRTPSWTPLDPKAHIEMATTLYWRLWESMPSLTDAERERLWTAPRIGRISPDGTFSSLPARQAIEGGDFGLATARFDLNFDGKPDTVYRFGLNTCISPRAPDGIDFAYSLFVSEADDPRLARATTRYARMGGGGVFLFKGRTYLVSGGWQFHVIEPFAAPGDGMGRRGVCYFRP